MKKKIEGIVEATGRRVRRCKQLLDNLKGKRSYSQLKKETLGCTQWRTGFGRGCGPDVRQTAERMDDYGSISTQFT